MQKSKSALFLMELIIVIFFFALTSAVCLQVFVKAHSVSENTKDLNEAILWADNAAEIFFEHGNDTETIKGMLSEVFPKNGEASYNLSFDSDDSFLYMTYSFDKKETHYSYTFKKHIQEVSHE